MNEQDFEGSLILEKLAALDLVDDFFEAVDSDDLVRVTALLKKADIDEETIHWVLDQIEDN